jgi:hypothetical protein
MRARGGSLGPLIAGRTTVQFGGLINNYLVDIQKQSIYIERSINVLG